MFYINVKAPENLPDVNIRYDIIIYCEDIFHGWQARHGYDVQLY